jgi:hypothetical protein
MLKQTSEGVLVFLKVTPKSSFSRITGKENDLLKVSIAAPPDKGEANEKLLSLLAKLFRVPKSSLHIEKGRTDRYKTVLVKGKTLKELENALQSLLHPHSKS